MTRPTTAAQRRSPLRTAAPGASDAPDRVDAARPNGAAVTAPPLGGGAVTCGPGDGAAPGSGHAPPPSAAPAPLRPAAGAVAATDMTATAMGGGDARPDTEGAAARAASARELGDAAPASASAAPSSPSDAEPTDPSARGGARGGEPSRGSTDPGGVSAASGATAPAGPPRPDAPPASRPVQCAPTASAAMPERAEGRGEGSRGSSGPPRSSTLQQKKNRHVAGKQHSCVLIDNRYAFANSGAVRNVVAGRP